MRETGGEGRKERMKDEKQRERVREGESGESRGAPIDGSRERTRVSLLDTKMAEKIARASAQNAFPRREHRRSRRRERVQTSG